MLLFPLLPITVAEDPPLGIHSFWPQSSLSSDISSPPVYHKELGKGVYWALGTSLGLGLMFQMLWEDESEALEKGRQK